MYEVQCINCGRQGNRLHLQKKTYRIRRNKRTVRLKNDYGHLLVVKSLIGVKNWDIFGYL